MPGRTLMWTGAAGTLDFGTPGNWTNAATGRAAKNPPGRFATVELRGSGNISGSGTVAVIDVTGDANTTFLLSDANLAARTVTIGSNANGGTFAVGGGSTLSANGAALNISIGSPVGDPLLWIGRNGGPGAALVALGGGTLHVGSAQGAGGSIDVDTGGSLTGGPRALIEVGANGGGGDGTVAGGVIAIGGMLELGVAGGAALLKVEGGSISAGVLVIGAQAGTGTLSADGGIISAGLLEVGAAGDGSLTGDGLTMTVGHAGRVGLSIASTAGSSGIHPDEGTIDLDASPLTVNGSTEIGLYGSGILHFGGPATLTTRGGVVIGNYQDGGTGLLQIMGASWLDTGAVVVDNGQLVVAGQGASTINGDLTIGGGPAGALASMSVAYASFNVRGMFDVAGSSVAQSVGDVVLGPSGTISATSLVVGGSGYGATLTAAGLGDGSAITLDAGTLTVGAGGVLLLGTCVARIGTGRAGAAASVSGSLWVDSGSLTVMGALDLNGPSDNEVLLVSEQGTVSVASSAAAVVCNDAGFEVIGANSLLNAEGGLDLLGGSEGRVDGGTLTASASTGLMAMTIDASSVLTDSGIFKLTGDALVEGRLLLQNGTLTESGQLTVAAGGTLSGWGSVAGGINDLGSISAEGGGLSFIGPIGGSGTIALSEGGGLALLGAVGAATSVEFAAAGTITLGDAAAFRAAIGGWAAGDVLNLLQVAAVSDSVTGQLLTLYDSGHDVVATLRFSQPITADNFVLTQDGHGNSVLSYHA